MEFTRLLHTMLRVKNLDQSIEFYTQQLGMTLQRRHDFADARFTLAFLGYGSEDQNTVLELTHNWDIDRYDAGNAFGHLAIAVKNLKHCCRQLEQAGILIKRQPGLMQLDKNSGRSENIAFIQDPDGYSIELIEK